jgi:murein L,D-transpeptidase YafK
MQVTAFHTLVAPPPKPRHYSTLSLLFALGLGLALLVALPGAHAAPIESDVWVAVDTEELSVSVMRGEDSLQIFENIAIGSNGPTLAKIRGDATTPLGEFTITEIRRSERFKLFMAINYPNLDHTERAFKDQRIDEREYRALRYDLDRGQPPVQSTKIGGQLGIHGLGSGDMKVHETVNWTEGCIALTNEQLLELAKWVVVGTRVVVR